MKQLVVTNPQSSGFVFENSSPWLLSLPNPLKQHILLFSVDSYTSLMNTSLTCKALHNLASSSQVLWCVLSVRSFPQDLPLPLDIIESSLAEEICPVLDWRAFYLEQYEKKLNLTIKATEDKLKTNRCNRNTRILVQKLGLKLLWKSSSFTRPIKAREIHYFSSSMSVLTTHKTKQIGSLQVQSLSFDSAFVPDKIEKLFTGELNLYRGSNTLFVQDTSGTITLMHWAINYNRIIPQTNLLRRSLSMNSHVFLTLRTCKQTLYEGECFIDLKTKKEVAVSFIENINATFDKNKLAFGLFKGVCVVDCSILEDRKDVLWCMSEGAVVKSTSKGNYALRIEKEGGIVEMLFKDKIDRWTLSMAKVSLRVKTLK